MAAAGWRHDLEILRSHEPEYDGHDREFRDALQRLEEHLVRSEPEQHYCSTHKEFGTYGCRKCGEELHRFLDGVDA